MRRLLAVALAVSSCAAPDASTEALRKQGFHDVEITGWSPLGCGEKDAFSTGFRATNASGERVDGVVCCGVLKLCTVRW